MDFPLRRNQSDSSESKIGSRCSRPPGGTVTWPSAASPPPGPAVPFAAPPALGPSLPWMFLLPTGDCGLCAGGELGAEEAEEDEGTEGAEGAAFSNR